jgi:hypothetical protein
VTHQQGGACRNGTITQMLIEPVTAYDDAVLREVGVFWPRRFDCVATVGESDSLHEVSANLRRVNLDVGELGNCAR